MGTEDKKMASKKRKSEDDPTTTTAAVVSNDATTSGKKRRRLSDADSTADKKSKKSKKEKKEKKSSKSSKKDKERKHAPSAEDQDQEDVAVEDRAAAIEANDSPEDVPMNDDAPQPPAESQSKETSKKSKKDKKSKSKSKDNKSEADAEAEPEVEVEVESKDAEPTSTEDPEEDSQQPASNKKVRFIVFVGNLPYAATPAQITAHFAAVHPTSVRLLHDPRTKKSRGIAFVEFARYDHMKSCLKTMHHTAFSCPVPGGKGPARSEERRINVELTAGGGGNTSHRKEKIRAKNEKLNEERARRALEEAKAKAEKEKEKAQNGGEAKKAAAGGVEDAIHPSRRGRVPGARS
ncbi:hypothetical protein F4811DRAFT_518393 [Daldinia bambusicola]|nr:hypothetical protein F4811DRAFT_518393 [Daldinia bambusicola]